MLYRQFFKPLTDFILAFVLFWLTLPLLLFLILLLGILNKGNIFFIQKRIGYKEQSFNILKFRTMVDLRDEKGNLLPDDLRTTSIGRLLRKTYLDELPQLINIIKGDMSFVGPRPLLPEYLSRYTIEEQKRHQVKAGLTGLAQIHGGHLLEWHKKMNFDMIYVEKQSFCLDLWIILKTFRQIFKK